MSSPTALSSPSPTSSSCVPARGRSRVSAEHTLNRVRENQRRHRARRKDYIHTLEIKLAETEVLLEAARAEIAVLRAERELYESPEIGTGRTRCMSKGTAQDLQDSRRREEVETGPEQPSISEVLVPDQEMDEGLKISYSVPVARFPPTAPLTPMISLSLPLLLDAPHDSECLPRPPTLATGPPPCCTDTPTSPSLDTNIDPYLSTTSSPPPTSESPECTTCATRPAPSPTESTTLCSQAYLLISQQNFRQIDAATIRDWLWQGYRSAVRRGEGCRVENGVLMSVLDFISGEM